MGLRPVGSGFNLIKKQTDGPGSGPGCSVRPSEQEVEDYFYGPEPAEIAFVPSRPDLRAVVQAARVRV